MKRCGIERPVGWADVGTAYYRSLLVLEILRSTGRGHMTKQACRYLDNSCVLYSLLKVGATGMFGARVGCVADGREKGPLYVEDASFQSASEIRHQVRSRERIGQRKTGENLLPLRVTNLFAESRLNILSRTAIE